MKLHLICRDVAGSVSFNAEEIEGCRAPERRYQISDHVILLAGQEDFILHHDADVLLSMAENFCRMPTPAEQDAFAAQERAASIAQESVPTDSAASPSAQEANP